MATIVKRITVGVPIRSVAIAGNDLNIAGDTGSDTLNVGTNQVLTFTGGEGIETTVTDNTVTFIAGEATTTTRGAASFDSDHFTVNAGGVSLKLNGIDATLVDFGTDSDQVSTDDVPEGSTNLYYADYRVRGAISASGDLSYDSDTGVFSFDVEQVYTKANFDSDWNLAMDEATIQGSGLAYDSSTNTLSIDSAELAAEFLPVLGGSLIPDTDSAYSLGSATHKWKDLFLSGGTIYIGDVQLKDSGGGLAAVDSNGNRVSLGAQSIDVVNITADSSYITNIGVSQITSNNATFDSANIDTLYAGTVTIYGNLQVDGTSTTVNSTELNIDDKLIVIGGNASDSSQLQGAGLILGDSDSYSGTARPEFTYDAVTNRWTMNKGLATTLVGNVTGQVSDISNHTTTDLTEGDNLYYTSARHDSDFDIRLADKSTTNLTEGDNLYYTRNRFDSALGDATSQATITGYIELGTNNTSILSYDSSTGNFTFNDSNVARTDIRDTYHSGLRIPSNQSIHFVGGSNSGIGRIFETSNNLVLSNSTASGQGNIVVRVTESSQSNFEVYKGTTVPMIMARGDSAVELYFNGVMRLETQDSGARVVGLLKADSADITNITVDSAVVSFITGGYVGYDSGYVKQFEADSAHISQLGADSAHFNNQSVLTTSIDSADISFATGSYVGYDSGYIKQLSMDSAHAGQFGADSAHFNNTSALSADIDTATLGQVTIDSAYATQLNIVTGDIDQATVDSATITNASITAIRGNLVPAVDSAYDLGTTSAKWRDLHLSGSSIFLGDVVLKDNNGSLEVTNTSGGNVDLTAGIMTADSAVVGGINFDVTKTTLHSTAAGTLYFDSDEQKGLSAVVRTRENPTPGVVMNLGQEMLVYVHNLTGAQIDNGDAVFVSGTAHNAHPQVSLAQADSAGRAQPFGVATMDIPDNGHGWVTRYGIVRDVNTGGLVAGANIYLSKDSAGKWSTTEVTVDSGYPFHLGKILKVDSSEGTIFIDPFTENYEYLRIQERLKVTGKIEGESAELKIINFNTTDYTDVDVPNNLPAFAEGNLFYFQGPDALTYSNASINVKLGQDDITRVYNNSGSTIAKGKAVYVTGAANDFPTIALAQADDNATVYTTLGLTSHEIPNGQFGFVTSRSLFGGLNTAAFSVGDRVYVSPDSAGELVNVVPTFPDFPFEVGLVLIADSAGGGNVGGCIQVDLRSEVFEDFRVVSNGRIDGNLTIAGDLAILGTETKTQVATLAVGDQYISVQEGDTVTTVQATGTGLNDVTFKDHYQGDSSNTFFVQIYDADVGGDVLKFGIDSAAGGPGVGTFTFIGFDSDGGQTTWNLTTDGNENIPLRHNITLDVAATTGHDSGDIWSGAVAPSNEDFGFYGNYNTGSQPYSLAGFFRDASDGKFKFFSRLDDSGISGNIDTTANNFTLGTVKAATFEGGLTGDVTGNADTATILETARTIAISGDITGTATSFNGSSNITISSAITAGSIVNDDINASAAIVDTKLATISTSGKVQNSATTATAVNTGSTIVARDASGNFAAGTITSEINRTAHTTVTAGEYGSASLVPIITVDSNGFVDSVGTVSVAGVSSINYDSSNGNFQINTADGGVFVETITLDPFTTTDLTEGTNEYYTRARFDSALGDATSTATIRGYFTANKGLSVASGEFNIDSANVKAMFAGDKGLSYSDGTFNIDSANVKAMFSGTSGRITYNSSTGNITIPNSGVTAGTYGSASLVPVLTIDSDGRVDSAGTVSVAGVSSTSFDSATGVFTINTADGGSYATHVEKISAGTGVSYDSATGIITSNDGQIVHDNLSGFVSNEHINHTSVSITAGTGLAGGGDISATRDLRIDSSEFLTYFNSSIVHDNLSGFVANEHIDHSSVSITAGTGLSGGGTIAATRDLAIDSAELNNYFGGAGKGFDADTLDGQHGSYYRINVYDASGTLLN